MARAIWMGAVLAESDACEIVEGNHYFPPCTVRREYLCASKTHTRCGWKGIAHYYDIVVNTQVNRNAAWYYPEPEDAVMRIENYIAFWHDVRIEP